MSADSCISTPVLCAVSVGLTIAGPKILGHATDLIFGPLMAHRPVDFDALGRVLALALALYLGSSLFGWLQGHLLNYSVQRTVKRLRTAVDGLPPAERGSLIDRLREHFVDEARAAIERTASLEAEAVELRRRVESLTAERDAADRKSTRLNSSHEIPSRMPSSA